MCYTERDGNQAVPFCTGDTMSDEYGYIYILSHPMSDRIYIGQTTGTLKSRLKTHLHGSKRSMHKNASWIKSLIAKGTKPQIIPFEKVPVSILSEREVFWIKGFREHWGDRVLNHLDGGEGWTKGKKMSEEAKKKMSKAHKGVVQSDVHKANRVAARKQNGDWFSEKDRRAISKGMLAKGANKGEKNPASKFTVEDILVIKKRLNAGESCPSIAKDYGVHRSCILKIRRGESWTHVQLPNENDN